MTGIQGRVALGVIRNQSDYLIMKRSENTSSSGKWAFPGGKIEEGESPKKAVLREVKEETALECEVVKNGESYFSEGELGTWEIYPFLLETDSRDVETNFEHSDFNWIKIADIDRFDTLGELRAIEELDIST